MSVVDAISEIALRRTLNTDPSFERLRYLVVLAASSEPPFNTSGVIIDGRPTFNIKQLWRIADHLGLDFERFRGAEKVYKYLEKSRLAGSVRDESTRYHEQYFATELGISQAHLNLDRLRKIVLLESQAKTMHMTIKKQLTREIPTVLEIHLKRKSMSIGRDSTNDLSVDDPYMSSSHARIIYDSARWTLEDLDSKNGSWKVEPNGLKRVIRNLICDGDVYQLGSTVFRFRSVTS